VTPFESLVYEPEDNVHVEPQEPSTFMALYGGFFFDFTGKQGQVLSTLGDVGKEGEGLAKAGGCWMTRLSRAGYYFTASGAA
jgi:hypothetical protein